MPTIVIQGHDRHGWDTETIQTLECLKAYLRHPHKGRISVYVDGVEHILPSGIGVRETSETTSETTCREYPGEIDMNDMDIKDMNRNMNAQDMGVRM